MYLYSKDYIERILRKQGNVLGMTVWEQKKKSGKSMEYTKNRLKNAERWKSLVKNKNLENRSR